MKTKDDRIKELEDALKTITIWAHRDPASTEPRTKAMKDIKNRAQKALKQQTPTEDPLEALTRRIEALEKAIDSQAEDAMQKAEWITDRRPYAHDSDGQYCVATLRVTAAGTMSEFAPFDEVRANVPWMTIENFEKHAETAPLTDDQLLNWYREIQ